MQIEHRNISRAAPTKSNFGWFLSGLISHRLVLQQLVHQQVTLRYHRTLLGIFWTLVNPLITMSVIAIVFATIMRIPLKSFAVFLYSGLVPWTLFSICVTSCAGILVANEGLIKKIYIPRQIFIASTSISTFIDSLFSMTALFIIAVAIGAPITSALLILPVSFIILLIFTVGISLVAASITVFFRDIPNLISIILQLGYYLTPILYPMSFVPEQYHTIFKLNPFFYFLELFRAPIYSGELPSASSLAITSAIAFIALFIGILVFRKLDSKIIFRL